MSPISAAPTAGNPALPAADDPRRNPFNRVMPPPPPLEITTANTALLVVDMQYFDAHPDWGEGKTAKELGVESVFDPYFAQLDDITPRIQSLLALFRGQQMEVIHLRVAELTRDSRDVGWKQLVRGLIVPNDWREADPLDELAPIDDELVISKSASGVFPSTNIDRLLRNMGITTLIMTGTSTGGCVESAVRDAVDLGYDVVVIADACAAGTVADHELALARMEGGLTRVMTTADITSLVGHLPQGNRVARSGLERVKAYLPAPPTTPPGPDVDPYDLIFGEAVQHEITPANTALLVVDAQRLTCDPSVGLGAMASASGDRAAFAAYYAQVARTLSGIATLTAAARAAGLPVIYLRIAGRAEDGRDLSRKVRSQGVQFGRHDPAAEIMPEVRPEAGDYILEKPGSGAFTGSGLDEMLRNLGMAHVILSGVSYDGGLESTVRSATDRGYGLIVVPEACASFTPTQQAGFAHMETGITLVRSLSTMVSRLAAFAAPA